MFNFKIVVDRPVNSDKYGVYLERESLSASEANQKKLLGVYNSIAAAAHYARQVQKVTGADLVERKYEVHSVDLPLEAAE